MTLVFLHGRRPWSLSLHRSAAVIDRRRCAALAAGIVARPVFDNRVAGATTAQAENCPWSSQFGFEFTVDFRLGQIARIGSAASAPSNAGSPHTSSRSWHLPILRS